MTPPGLRVEAFDPAQALALVQMWRESFEFGVGIRDPHPIEEQVTFLLEKLVPAHTIAVAKRGDRIAGFCAHNAESVAALYVRVQDIGQGIGSWLLRLAQEQSSGHLWLYTFARNHRARRFYRHHGFVEAAHGFENMWQLEDVRCQWLRPVGTA
jgi:ribosomal protein S18 acetylase RimI-like enzyme